MNRIQQLHAQGQSVWCDNLSRRMIDSGELTRLVGLGVVGITSNPTIFMKAISNSTDYDNLLAQVYEFPALSKSLSDALVDAYERLVLPDIADAADVLRPVYERTHGVDGYVSLEVNPKLAYDTAATVAEARRLFGELNRSNVFIKVPATDQGIPAIETLIGEGINVNVTLIFSIAMYEKVMKAYINGLKRLQAAQGDLSSVASVASFFVSRVDTEVDQQLASPLHKGGHRGVEALPGKAAVANAKLAYVRFREVFAPRGDFADLAAHGARVQRPLWASTSTKNPAYRDTMYVDDLVGPETVNTMPPETLAAVLDHGRTEVTVDRGLDAARDTFRQLAKLGIDMKAVTDKLTLDGVNAFARSFDELIAHLSQKCSQLHHAKS
jgi:transaldolase